jgi:hypothetical protein
MQVLSIPTATTLSVPTVRPGSYPATTTPSHSAEGPHGSGKPSPRAPSTEQKSASVQQASPLQPQRALSIGVQPGETASYEQHPESEAPAPSAPSHLSVPLGSNFH